MLLQFTVGVIVCLFVWIVVKSFKSGRFFKNNEDERRKKPCTVSSIEVLMAIYCGIDSLDSLHSGFFYFIRSARRSRSAQRGRAWVSRVSQSVKPSFYYLATEVQVTSDIRIRYIVVFVLYCIVLNQSIRRSNKNNHYIIFYSKIIGLLLYSYYVVVGEDFVKIRSKTNAQFYDWFASISEHPDYYVTFFV